MCPFPVGLCRFVDLILDSLVDICLERADLLAFRLCCFTLYCLDVLFLSRMVSGEGSGIRLYRFLIIAVSSSLHYFQNL